MAKVLVVEDSKVARENWIEFLNRHGHSAFGVPNGSEGLEALAHEPDIVFCDFSMPVMDGHEFSARVRTDPAYVRHARIPIIGVGGFPLDRRDHLTEMKEKPMETDELLAYIVKYCNA